jgi:hypothetical protein
MNTSPPPGYKEDTIRFTVAAVSTSMVAQQLTGMQTGTAYILKEVRIYMPGTVGNDAYLDVNTVATDVAATKLGGIYYQSGAFLVWDGNGNGILSGNLSAKPYVQVCKGAGSDAQTVYGTAHYYYK